MERNRSDQSSIDEPNRKRQKLETNASTSSKTKANNDDCPILMLPPDILAKVIAYIPIAQWPALELLYDFRPATLIAWRQRRNINIEREFLIKPQTANDRSAFGKCLVSILQKLTERSPFLISLRGIKLHRTKLISDVIKSLAKFEHLQSITLGDRRGGIALEAVVEFLEITQSRMTLKQLHSINVRQLDDHRRPAFLERFATSFVDGQEIQSPLKLEEFSFASSSHSLFVGLDTLDTTTLTDLRLGRARVEPQQLTRLIERSPSLRHIELSFLYCGDDVINDGCGAPRLQANKKLLVALASHGNLTSLTLNWHSYSPFCSCMHFDVELIEMLETIGRHGKLRKLTLGQFLLLPSIIDLDEVCSTIRMSIPYLQSVKLAYNGYVSHGNLTDIVSVLSLEEIHFMNGVVAGSDCGKIAQLPRLKRLAFDGFNGDDDNLLQCLTNATTLLDLRLRDVDNITANVFENWGEGIASNLQILMLGRIAEKVDPYSSDENDVEEGLVRLLEKAVRLRVLILEGHITDQSLITIAKSCPELETFGVESSSNEITVQALQEIVNRCPKLKRLGGFSDAIRNRLRLPKYKKIGVVDMEFWYHDFDSGEYD